jgi:hypothetical protein
MIAIRKEIASTKTPIIMPGIASPKLIRLLVIEGKANEIPVTMKPSKTPKIPKTKTAIFIISPCFF